MVKSWAVETRYSRTAPIICRAHISRSVAKKGDESDEERGDHAGKRRGAEDRAGLGSGEFEGLREVGADDDVPGSPDDVGEEHHQGESRGDVLLLLHKN